MGAGTSGNNLVTLTEYDNAGRVSKRWLPYAAGSLSDYVLPSVLKDGVGAGYGNDSRPYSETQHEASTLGRTLKEYAPGRHGQPIPKRWNTSRTRLRECWLARCME